MEVNEDGTNFSSFEKRNRNAKLISGLFIILFGVFILLDQLDIEIPKIFRSWELILIMIGIVLLVKHNFKNFGAYVLIILGTALLLNDYYPHLIQIRLVWPIIIILFGITILIKAFSYNSKKKIKSNFRESFSGDEYFESTTIFGSNVKKINTLNFKGASVSCIFGGSEMNLLEAEIQENATMEISCIFSGVTVIVPSGWNVKSELTSVFGGVDDKRIIKNENTPNAKTLFLKGTCVFGGIDLTNFPKD